MKKIVLLFVLLGVFATAEEKKKIKTVTEHKVADISAIIANNLIIDGTFDDGVFLLQLSAFLNPKNERMLLAFAKVERERVSEMDKIETEYTLDKFMRSLIKRADSLLKRYEDRGSIECGQLAFVYYEVSDRFRAVLGKEEKDRVLLGIMKLRTRGIDKDLVDIMSMPLSFNKLYADNIEADNTGLVLYKGHYYKIVKKKTDWRKALVSSRRMGGYLAVINDQKEDSFLRRMVGSDACYFDMRYDADRGWGDMRRKSNYTDWKKGSSRRVSSLHVGVITWTGWTSVTDNGKRYFVVEYDSDPNEKRTTRGVIIRNTGSGGESTNNNNTNDNRYRRFKK